MEPDLLEQLDALTRAMKPLKAMAATLGYDLILRDARRVSEPAPLSQQGDPVPAFADGDGKEAPFKTPTDAVAWAIHQIRGKYTTRGLMNFVKKVDPAVTKDFDYSSFQKALKRRARPGGLLKSELLNNQNFFERITP